jgi:predicted permease
LRAVLQGGDRTSGDRAAARRRLALISLEVAVATLLLVGTGLTARSLWWLSHRDTGYDRTNLVTGMLDLPRTRYPDRPALQRFVRQLHAELQAIPGIEGASLWGPRMLGRATYNLITTPEGLDPADPKNHFMTRRLHMTPDALPLLKVSLLRGRLPTDQPAPGAPWEIVISEKYAQRFFPGQDPIGRRVAISNSSPVEYMVVVGVAAPVHHYPRAESEDNVLGDIYLSMWNVPAANLSFLVRSSGDAGAVIRAVRGRIARIDPTLAVVEAQTMESRLAGQERPQRFAAGVFAVYGGLATFLAVLGVYGVLAFSVSQRTREFGVRLAVGASPAQILTRLLAQGALWIGLGLATGLLAAWFAGSLVSALLVGITPTDPLVYAAVATLILLSGLSAWALPAIRASRTDPLVALRTE